MLKVFCEEELEKQSVVHGMETAHEDFSCSVWAGGALGTHQGCAGGSPAPGRVGVLLRSSHQGGWCGPERPGSSPGEGSWVVSPALDCL